jgi:hypothetical protein
LITTGGSDDGCVITFSVEDAVPCIATFDSDLATDDGGDV